MYRHIVPALVAFTMTLALPQLVKAGEADSDATVVVYRADESFKTDNLRFDLHAGSQYVGRMKADKSVVFNAPAGSYTLDTNMPGAEPITLELKPGAVHYIHSQLRLTGNRVELGLVEVPEQVAISQGATDMAGAI